MSGSGGSKHWHTAQEIADLALPGLPRSKRKVNELATEQGWAFREGSSGEALARRREGRGGGFEYHWAVLPPAAKTEMVRRGLIVTVAEVKARTHSRLWTWYDAQSAKVKADAVARLRAVDAIEAHEAAGFTTTAAIAAVAADLNVSTGTLWNWRGLVEGVEREDRLPRIAPRRVGGGKQADIHPDAWQALISDYLRPEKPTFKSCYRRLEGSAAKNGWGAIPHVKTLQRRLETEVDRRVIMARREGADAVRRMLPPQTRSVAALHALQCVNVDGHKWDVFVTDGEKIFRPVMVAIQDVYSRKMLAWRIGETESAVQTRLAFADLFRNWGIPLEAYLDNGRAFASKWITGGALTRFRFKVREEDQLGLLTSLGIKTHWTLPYRGQSKPIERGFRDLCDDGAKHPAFAGAYVGNKPDAKPENYGSRAVPLADFIAIANQVIAEHNARTGRNTEMARGQSFDQAFAESYATAPIGKAAPEQMRLALLSAERVRIDRRTSVIRFCDNTYWTSELTAWSGQQVIIRFDPDDLHAPLHVYDLESRFLVTAPVFEAVGFQDAEAAQARARLERGWKKAVRAETDALRLLTAAQVAALQPTPQPEAPAPEAGVIRPVRFAGVSVGAAALKARPEPDTSPENRSDRFTAAVTRLRLAE